MQDISTLTKEQTGLLQVPGSVASWPSGSRHRNTHVGTCQSRQGSTPAPTPTPRLSAGCKAAKGQRTCSPDRVASHHTGTQCCHPVVKPRVLLPRGLRKMWLSTQQRKQVCHFLLACTLVSLSPAQKTHSMGCSESSPGFRPGRWELVNTVTGTSSAFRELHVHGQEHGDLHTLSLPPAHPPFPEGCLLASQLGVRSMTVPFAVPALTRRGSVRSGLTASFRGWVLPFLQGWSCWVIGHTVLAFPPALH